MSYTKHFRNMSGASSPISGRSTSYYDTRNPYGDSKGFRYQTYMNSLPEVYVGHPNRVERYNVYDMMDIDPEINACLDIIAEFSTQTNVANDTPFDVVFHDSPTPHEVELLKSQLQQWCRLNELSTRAFKIFRNTIKYGDQVFVRDPETFKLYWVDMPKVVKVIVNESEGKLPEQYVLRDLNINLQNLSATQKSTVDFGVTTMGSMGSAGVGSGGFNMGTGGTSTLSNLATNNSRFQLGQGEFPVDAKHIVHLSLTEGLDRFWPFGQSVLESVFKVYKQKELTEDAILLYRVQRAPERRLFKIDTGDLPANMAMAFVEQVKNEVHQKRMPGLGGGASVVDTSYNPLSMLEDYYFPQSKDGRGSSIEVLPGGQNLGEIDDLRYFNNRLARGLRVPSSYLPTGPDDSTTPLSDGRVGTAMIQEFRFNQYCQRLQNYISRTFDEEFKLFLKWRGLNIDSGLFTLKFNSPQNFAAYRQSELDSARVNTFTTMESIPYISKRFAMERFLGLTESEIETNRRLWEEEHGSEELDQPTGSDIRDVGVSPGGFTADQTLGNELEMGMGNTGMDMDMGDLGGDMGGAEGGAAPADAPAAGGILPPGQ